MRSDFSLPPAASKKIDFLLKQYPVTVKVVKKRKTKHGDFRRLSTGEVVITLNRQENPYRFLITFLHELAHHKAFSTYGQKIMPHGKEWRQCFRQLSLPFLTESIFPQPLLNRFAQHLKHPKASSDIDSSLAMALQAYDPPTDKITIFDLAEGSYFTLDSGRVFCKGKQRRKRIECQEISTGNVYLFQPHARVNRMECI